jgi:hypothetical protein
MQRRSGIYCWPAGKSKKIAVYTKKMIKSGQWKNLHFGFYRGR